MIFPLPPSIARDPPPGDLMTHTLVESLDFGRSESRGRPLPPPPGRPGTPGSRGRFPLPSPPGLSLRVPGRKRVRALHPGTWNHSSRAAGQAAPKIPGSGAGAGPARAGNGGRLAAGGLPTPGPDWAGAVLVVERMGRDRLRAKKKPPAGALERPCPSPEQQGGQKEKPEKDGRKASRKRMARSLRLLPPPHRRAGSAAVP